MYDGPIVDSHHHLWEWRNYPWLVAPVQIFCRNGRQPSADRFLSRSRRHADRFGAGRCFYGSNFPLEKLWASYDDLVATTKRILANRPAAEQRKYFHDTATAFYRI